ncbi:MAG: hypothetical protein ACYTGZ_01295 [Planctomycetota bacterium]
MRRRLLRKGEPGLDIRLRRRRLRDRKPRRPASSWGEVVTAAALAAAALGFLARGIAGSVTTFAALLFLPFAFVALIGIWMSRLPTHQKILWSIPAAACAIPFLPIG